MHKILRIALFWLLAVAVSVQGASAATMLSCASATHRHHAAQSQAVEHVGHHGHHHHNGGHHHSIASETAEGGGTSVHAVAGKCATCAACCMVMALPMAIVAFHPIQVEAVVKTCERHVDVAFLTDGPERPPRRTLA